MPEDDLVRFRDREIAALATSMTARLSELADQLAERIRQAVEVYGPGVVVPLDDLRTSCRNHLEFLVGQLALPGPVDLSVPRAIGRRRADQGAPLSAIMDAYRVGSRFIWDSVVGVSPTYTELADTPRALQFARIALASSAPGSKEVVLFDDAPLSVVVASAQDTAARVARTILGPLLDLPATNAACCSTPSQRGSPRKGPRRRPHRSCSATRTRSGIGSTASSSRPDDRWTTPPQ